MANRIANLDRRPSYLEAPASASRPGIRWTLMTVTDWPGDASHHTDEFKDGPQREMRSPQTGQFSLWGETGAPQPGHFWRLGWDWLLESADWLARVPKISLHSGIINAAKMISSTGPFPKCIG